MTEAESLYLTICLAMFGVFAFALAYTTWSWERWQSRVAVKHPQPEQARQAETRLAA